MGDRNHEKVSRCLAIIYGETQCPPILAIEYPDRVIKKSFDFWVTSMPVAIGMILQLIVQAVYDP